MANSTSDSIVTGGLRLILVLVGLVVVGFLALVRFF